MNLNEPYFRAPVMEAIFEIQVELPLEVTVVDLEKLCNEITSEYPKKRPRKRFEGKIEFQGDQTPVSKSIDLGIDGFLNWSINEKQVVQFRFDGYSFSVLKPYYSWDKHFPDVIKNWNIYSNKVSPVRIKRIAIRFINVIEIPGESDLQDYFINSPKLPSEISVLNNFFNRIEFLIPEKNINAVVTQTLAKSFDPINKPIILDIEASRDINLQINEKSISDVFQMLRDVKNDIFKKSLMKKTMELFR